MTGKELRSKFEWIIRNEVYKLWKRDIKRIIAGYQAMIKQYKRALGGAEE